MNAHEEEKFTIAHAAVKLDDKGKIKNELVEARKKVSLASFLRRKWTISILRPIKPFSVATSMIPFMNHDDANRTLMGSNMQKQATPCVVPEAPIVATGVEGMAARDTHRVLYATEAGEVVQNLTLSILLSRIRKVRKKNIL
jgi:DNA-directed RNA polymerase subunit beta